MFLWLSDDIVRFKIKVGVEEKTLDTQNGHSCSMMYTPCCW